MKSCALRTLLALIVPAIAACGSLDGHPGSPSVLATLQGKLSLTESAPSMPDHVHVAIIWQTSVPNHFNVAEDIPVQPVFPSEYVLRLTEPPPDSVIQREMIDGGPLVSFATGAVVAYEDLNGNGQLDLVSNDAGAFIDRVVATNPDLAIAYLDSSNGQLPPLPSGDGMPTLGYNVLARNCTPVDGSARGPDGGDCLWSNFLPMNETRYDLPFSNDPKLGSLMCQASSSSSAAGFGTGYSWNVAVQGTPPDGYPIPGAPGLTCSADGTSYHSETCQMISTGLCTAPETDCVEQEVSLGDVGTPPGWPCP